MNLTESIKASLYLEEHVFLGDDLYFSKMNSCVEVSVVHCRERLFFPIKKNFKLLRQFFRSFGFSDSV